MAVNIIDPANINFEDEFAIAYADPRNGKYLAMNLITYGAGIFKEAIQLRQLNDMEELLRRPPPTWGPDEERFKNLVQLFGFGQPIDDVRFIIFFENYMKAMLLTNGYIIHVIKESEPFKRMSKDQKSRPILVSELRNVKEFDFDGSGQVKIRHTHITGKTLMFSILATPKYQSIIGLSPELLKIVIAVSKRRNKIHFDPMRTFSVSRGFIDQIRAMNHFVDNVAVPLAHSFKLELIRDGAQQL